MDFTSHPSRLLCSCVWTFFCELERTHEFAVISGCFQRWRKHRSQSQIRCTKPLDPVTNRIEEYLTRATPKRAAGTHLNFELLAGSLSWLSWLRFSNLYFWSCLSFLCFGKKHVPDIRSIESFVIGFEAGGSPSMQLLRNLEMQPQRI